MSDDKKDDGPDLKYGLLGEDSASDLEKLEKYTGEVGWDYLEKQYKAGALLYVDPSLDLVAVGKAFTDDDAEAVAKWKKSGDLVVPSTPHAFYWEEAKARFMALVVSPFVLIQPVEENE
ncbi:MAG: DUF2288 family protein [Verrucomicrobiales bacterium]|nr:DUF2288 family protein [Verrucomicrobiales bacterium]